MFTTSSSRSRRSTPIRLCLNRWPLLLIIIFLQLVSCHKNKDPQKYCPPSSCGNIQNISYPFRLDTDPPNCGLSSFAGDKNFTLSCHNNSSLFWYLNNDSSGRFLVKGINYEDFTIHLVDPGVQQNNCSSLPISPISSSSFYYNPYYTTDLWRWRSWGPWGGGVFQDILSRAALLISCDRKQIYGSVDSYSYSLQFIAPCKSKISKKYSFVVYAAGEFDVPLDQNMESCSIDMITLLPFTFTNDYNMISYQEIHTKLSDGFHVSWFPIFCQPTCSGYDRCLLDKANRPTCVNPYRTLFPDYYIKAWFLPAIHAGYYGDGLFHPFGKENSFSMTKRLMHLLDQIFKMIGWLINMFMLLGALRVMIFLLGGPCVFIFLIYKWRRRHLSSYNTIEEFLQNQNDLMPIRYSYKDIKKVTSCFKEKLGEGGYGCVYKGKLRSGHFAAVKVLDKSSKKTHGQDFMNEVATIGRIHHVNVVQLIGYCAEQSKRALVYDFMSNGSLDKYIFAKEGLVSLSWDKFFEISLGVARGIEYLHRGCDIQILHFDIKPHNILLDENFIPKISDFGLAKMYSTTKDTITSLTAARGTIGYMAPELYYKNIGRVSYKADVYSFGMLLLEMAGKRKSLNALVEKSSQIYFPFWIYDQVSKGHNIEIGYNGTEGEVKLVKKMIIVGLWCIQMNPISRPPMNKVVEMLEGDRKLRNAS